jgi:hypothetical protein
MICLHFSRVAESAQRCAKQAIIAVTAASQLTGIIDAMTDAGMLLDRCIMDNFYSSRLVRLVYFWISPRIIQRTFLVSRLAAKLYSGDSLNDEDEEEHSDHDESEDDRYERESAEARARKEDPRKAARGSREGARDGDGSESEKTSSGDSVRALDGCGGGGGEDDTVTSLLGKLCDLHVAMRYRHCQKLLHLNTEVLELQRRVAQRSRETEPIGAPAASESQSPPSLSYGSEAVVDLNRRHLLSTLADLVNDSCIAIDAACCSRRLRVRGLGRIGRDLCGTTTVAMGDGGDSTLCPNGHESGNVKWWSGVLDQETDWLMTLTYQDRVAIAASTRGKVLRVAATLEPGELLSVCTLETLSLLVRSLVPSLPPSLPSPSTPVPFYPSTSLHLLMIE